MDSGNSSSMQSSSGGEDQEYESRPDQSMVPAFLMSSGSSAHFNPLVSHHHQVQVQDHSPTFFDPSSNYLNAAAAAAAFSQSQPINSLLSFDGVRPRGGGGGGGLRSDQPNSSSSCTVDLANLPGSSSSSTNYSMFGTSQLGQGGLNQVSSSTSMQSRQLAHDHHQNPNGARSLTTTQSDQTTSTTNTVGGVKNPKKRTRASRRAPTTVLTTDTSNFRAMVQEFTGIPAPPFSASSYSRRLDLFGSGSGMRTSTHFEPIAASLYPLRPSAKRVQPSTTPSLLTTNPLADASNNTSTNAYQLPSDLGLLKQPPPQHDMLNMQSQSPVLSFQSFLQPPTTTLHPSLNLPGFGVKPSLDELGMSHGHVNANLGGLQGHVRSSDDSDSNWRDGNNNNNDDHQDHHLHHLRPLDHGNYGNDHHQSVVNNSSNGCKLNYSAAAAASSSDFHHGHDKHGLDNVSSRAEGTVDPWINCPAAE